MYVLDDISSVIAPDFRNDLQCHYTLLQRKLFLAMSSETLARYNRKIIIGDVHGCYDELIHLLTKLEYNSDYDELFFVGDLVVKGPNQMK